MFALNFLRRSQKIVSFSLLAAISSEMLFPLASYASVNQLMTSSGNSPVAASTSSMVDGYTGDFRYSVPLVTVPGPNGESVAINANYHAGIGVNQKASWLGLGWDYSPGEINRSVVGTPDDYNGRFVNETRYSSLLHKRLMFGSIYSKNMNNTQSYYPSINYSGSLKGNDFFTTYRHLPELIKRNMFYAAGMGTAYEYGAYDTQGDKYRFSRYSIPFQSVAYDEYSVSGGISGQLHPFTLGAKNYLHSDRVNTDNTLSVNTNTVQFYFVNSSNQNINTSTASNSAYVNQTNNRIHSGTYVKFYTNAEINNNSNLFDNTNQTGFLDYYVPAGTRRPASDYDPDGIGAFEITDASGVTYHYSLPVYTWEEESFEAKSADLSSSSNYATHNYYGEYNGISKPHKTASSWKLTAVTGADYQDVNNNKTVDEGDSGYWINYNYSLWNDDYYSSSLRYGYKEDGSVARNTPAYASLFNGKTFKPNVYQKTANFSRMHSQIYALNYIQTASHTAFFVKSVRLDEQSYDNVENTASLPTPLLKLDRVILLRNEDKALLINSTAMSSGDKDSRFSYSNCSTALADNNFIHVTKYTAQTAAIKQASLKTAEFETDYSLARKYTGNVNTAVTTYSIQSFTSSDYLFTKLTSIDNNHAQSGKLTLNKIKFYELNGLSLTPSVDFDYAASDADKNPYHNQDMTDLWGYYKKDYINSHYVTDVSRKNVDAWSLREITTSLGAKIQMEYESDVYHTEGFSDDPDYMPLPNTGIQKSTMPHLVFPVKSLNETTMETTMEDYDSWPYFQGIDRDYSIPTESRSSLVLNYLDRCTRNIIYYNYGNSSIPYTKTVEKHIHKGNSTYYPLSTSGYSNPYAGSGAYSLGPHNVTTYPINLFGQDYSLLNQCSATGQTHSSVHAANYQAMDFVTIFRSYLYGGGLRVKKISVNEPFKNLTYSQEFNYGNGYCPVVPKPTALCYGVAPNNYDVSINYKPLINSQLNSRVGYDYIQTTIKNDNGDSNGSVKETFNNELIANPIIFKTAPTMNTYTLTLTNAHTEYVLGYCTSYNPASGSGQNKVFANSYTFNMMLSRGNNMLGLTRFSEVFDAANKVVAKTTYKYATGSYIEERCEPTSAFDAVEYFTFLQAIHCAASGAGFTQLQDALYVIKYPENYNYHFTYRFYNSPKLTGTITERDGIISYSDVIGTDPLTGLSYESKLIDPTVGTLLTTTKYAYNNGYSAFDLKSKNETNKNQPALVFKNSTVKNNKYIIANSYVTYNDSFPTRTYNTTTNKYENVKNKKNWYRLKDTYSRLLDDDVLATTTPTSTDFRKTSVGTLYDKEYNRIEEEGLNSRKTASKWGYNNRYKLADISNANYNSFTFTGFEDQVIQNTSPSVIHFGGEVTSGQTRSTAVSTMVNGVPVIVSPHTGSYMSAVAAGNAGPIFSTENIEKDRTYIAKVWVHKNSAPGASLTIKLTGSTGISQSVTTLAGALANTYFPAVTVGNWVLITAELNVPANLNLSAAHSLSVTLSNTSGGTSAYFDDLSFHPKDAVLTGNVYNAANGLLIAQLDNENFATLYNYDSAGRLISAYKEYSGGIIKVSESQYHFAKP